MGLDDKVVVVTGGCDLRPAFLHQRRNPCVSLSLCVNLLRCTADNEQGCGVPSESAEAGRLLQFLPTCWRERIK